MISRLNNTLEISDFPTVPTIYYIQICHTSICNSIKWESWSFSRFSVIFKIVMAVHYLQMFILLTHVGIYFIFEQR